MSLLFRREGFYGQYANRWKIENITLSVLWMGMPPSSAASKTLCRCQSGSDDVQASHQNKKHGEAKRTNISSAQIIGQEHYT